MRAKDRARKEPAKFYRRNVQKILLLLRCSRILSLRVDHRTRRSCLTMVLPVVWLAAASACPARPFSLSLCSFSFSVFSRSSIGPRIVIKSPAAERTELHYWVPCSSPFRCVLRSISVLSMGRVGRSVGQSDETAFTFHISHITYQIYSSAVLEVSGFLAVSTSGSAR